VIRVLDQRRPQGDPGQRPVTAQVRRKRALPT
jgi:hypothetical protein